MRSLPKVWRLRHQLCRLAGERCEKCGTIVFQSRTECPKCGGGVELDLQVTVPEVVATVAIAASATQELRSP